MVVIFFKRLEIIMKYFYIIVFLLLSVTNSMSAPVNIKLKKLTSCFEYVDLYSRIVEGVEDPTLEDQKNFDLAVERILGYITGIEVGTRTMILMKNRGITEMTILEDVNKSCLVAPNISIDQAVLSLSIVNAAIMNANSKNGQLDWQSCQQFCDE